jgi:hypothetical protein
LNGAFFFTGETARVLAWSRRDRRGEETTAAGVGGLFMTGKFARRACTLRMGLMGEEVGGRGECGEAL